MTSQWYVWIAAISESYAEILAGRLVSHGWTVAPLGKTLTNSAPDSVVAIGFNLTKVGDAAIDKHMLMKELSETMELLNMSWTLVVISLPTEAIWRTNSLPRPQQVKDESSETTIIH